MEIKVKQQVETLEKKKAALADQIKACQAAAGKGSESAGRKAASLAKKLGRTGLEKTPDGKKFNAQKHGVRQGAANNNDGGWKNGKQHGMGTWTSATGQVKEGEWKDGKRMD